MNRQRLRLARRIAGIQAFREEQQRQHFADAIRSRVAAEEHVRVATEARDEVDLARESAISSGGLARYLLLGELAAQAERQRAEAVTRADGASAAETAGREAWSLANVRKRSSGDRSDAMHREASQLVETVDTAESIERWLVRRGSTP
jgi:hypothetical protein